MTIYSCTPSHHPLYVRITVRWDKPRTVGGRNRRSLSQLWCRKYCSTEAGLLSAVRAVERDLLDTLC